MTPSNSKSPKKRSTAKRKKVDSDIKLLVLLESGYKCGSPTCRNVLTLQLHHIVWVRDGGGNEPENLLPLCGHCHDLHTAGHIPDAAIRVWKSAISALNSVHRGAADSLLHLERMSRLSVRGNSFYSNGDLLLVAPLINAGLVRAVPWEINALVMMTPFGTFELALTERGIDFVEAWRAGNEHSFDGAVQQQNRTG